jgi:hypothetical protein
LISAEKIDVGGPVLMIGHMNKIGKTDKTENYNVYRTGMEEE